MNTNANQLKNMKRDVFRKCEDRKFECIDCGKIVPKNARSMHLRTKTHLEAVKEKETAYKLRMEKLKDDKFFQSEIRGLASRMMDSGKESFETIGWCVDHVASVYSEIYLEWKEQYPGYAEDPEFLTIERWWRMRKSWGDY